MNELAQRICVEHPAGYFSKKALQTFFARHLGHETLEHLVSSTDAMWVSSSHAALKNGRLYCFSSVGLTEESPAKRNPRLPAIYYSGVRLVKAGEDQSDEGIRVCRSAALESAVASMMEDSLSAQRQGSSFTRENGKQTSGLKPEPSTARMFSSGLSPEVRQRAFDAIPSDFRKAFDYRKLEWTALAWVYRLDGHTICRADVGVAAHPPEGRNPRNPGYVYSSTWEMTEEQSRQRGAEDTCKGDMVVSAIEGALEDSWDKAGLLDSFELTKEDGVPLVAPVKRAKPVAATAAAPAHPSSPPPAMPNRMGKCQPPSGKVLRYSDRCTNGDCTRTFENGCSVRFQAPYCYDLLSSSWKWKPDGC